MALCDFGHSRIMLYTADTLRDVLVRPRIAYVSCNGTLIDHLAKLVIHISESGLGDLPDPHVDLLSAGILSLYLCCPDQRTAICMAAVVRKPSCRFISVGAGWHRRDKVAEETESRFSGIVWSFSRRRGCPAVPAIHAQPSGQPDGLLVEPDCLVSNTAGGKCGPAQELANR